MLDLWEKDHFGSILVSDGAVGEDFDLDGFMDGDEYWAGTDPTNDLSLLEWVATPTLQSNSVVVEWSSVAGKAYSVFGCTDLAVADWNSLTSAVPASVPTTSVTFTPTPAETHFRVKLDVGR